MKESIFFFNQKNQLLHEGTALADVSLFSHSEHTGCAHPGCPGLGMVSGGFRPRGVEAHSVLPPLVEGGESTVWEPGGPSSHLGSAAVAL